MYKNLFVAVSLFLLVGGLTWWYFGSREIKNYPSSGTDIIAFGDSLIEGTGASSPEKSFISLLSKKIGKPITNLGESGDTTEKGVARLSEIDSYHPKVVIVLFGGNDRLKRVPMETTFANLSKIIRYIQLRGGIVLLLGVRGGLMIDEFAPEFKKLSETYNTAYVTDVLDGLFGNPNYMADAVHPNDAGNVRIADRIYPALKPLLR